MSCSNGKKFSCKSSCKTKHLTEEQGKKYKRKMNEWIDESKSVYVCEDLAHKLICYINLGVIERNEFRKNLSAKNYQSIRIERSIIAIIMKIFAKEIMVRQYQILGLPYRVDLCFVVHQLIIEIDKDGHPYYKNNEIRQKFTFIKALLLLELILILILIQVLI